MNPHLKVNSSLKDSNDLQGGLGVKKSAANLCQFYEESFFLLKKGVLPQFFGLDTKFQRMVIIRYSNCPNGMSEKHVVRRLNLKSASMIVYRQSAMNGYTSGTGYHILILGGWGGKQIFYTLLPDLFPVL